MSPFYFKNFTPLPFINHGIFGRRGGTSLPPFDSLNVGLGTGDNREAVAENRRRIIHHLGGGTPLFLSQVHGDGISILKKNVVPDIKAIQGTAADAAVTDIPGILLFIMVADCQPVMLVDPLNRVVANIHSGWRGSVQNIIGKTVDAMEDNFGSKPENILAGIGPSLGPCCGEFINYKEEIPESLWSYKDDAFNFDFRRMSRDQLLNRGVRQKNIEEINHCTRCRADLFFSYRAEKRTGRFAAVIKIV